MQIVSASAQQTVLNWWELETTVRERVAPVLESKQQTAESRWQTEFVSSPGSAAGLIITYAAMEAAGIWDCVKSLINSWIVGVFFVPSDNMHDLLNSNENFVRLNQFNLRHRWAHHDYWQDGWMQTNVRNAVIHIGKNRKMENGFPKAEVHLDVYNGFFNGFDLSLSVKHLVNEVVRKRRHSPTFFSDLLQAQGVSIPVFLRST
ncbi:MAG TPA: hypothetical protein VFC63_16970 [Blastocatellia bacterium]|nr:hypothetical protein [Blastocatellia bacterium]